MNHYKSLIHVGYGKAGATFLHNWFTAHPQLVYEQYGIGGFTNIMDAYPFMHTLKDVSGPVYFVTSHEDLSFWKGPVKLIGAELTPYPVKEHQEKVCQWLHAIMPNSMVLIITRGFESVIKSAYSQYIKVGGILPFPTFLTRFKPLLIDFWDYDYLITLYTKYFSNNNMIILPYELLQESSSSFLHHIEQKLGINSLPFPAHRVNPSLSGLHLHWRLVISQRAATLSGLLPNWLAERFYKLNVKNISNNRKSRLIKLLSKFNESQTQPLSFPDDYLSAFANKATILKKIQEYNNYLHHYLIEK